MVIQALGVDFSPRLVFEGTKLFSESTRILVDAMKAGGAQAAHHRDRSWRWR